MSQLLSAVACCSYSLLKTFEGECKLLCLPANEHILFVQVNTCHEAETLSTEFRVFYTCIHSVTPHCQNMQTVLCTMYVQWQVMQQPCFIIHAALVITIVRSYDS